MVIGSFTLIPNGHFLIAALVISIAMLFDAIDGTMARLSNIGQTTWGNFLDSTLDRVADASVLIALFIYLGHDRLATVVVFLIPASMLVPYARAKAESLNISASVGFAERTERLIILGLAGVLHGMGVAYSLAVGIWILFVLSAITVAQRAHAVWIATR